MKILVFGTGVIGTIYGYVLAQAGQDVTHYVRASKIPALTGGIDLQLLDARYSPAREERTVYRPRLTETLRNGDGYDLVIVSVRHHQLDSVLRLLRDRIGNAHVLLFGGNWSGFDGLEEHMPRARFLLGFPVAGGGFRGATLDGSLLNEVRLGELDGQNTARLRAIRRVFESAGIKVDIQPNMEHWLWVHFAINSGIIGAAFQAGGAERLLNNIEYLHAGILAGREALAVCRARGVDVDAFEDASAFYLPAWLGAIAIWFMMKSNMPTRKIMETHTALDELRAIYSDVLRTGEELQVAMPHLAALRNHVEQAQALQPTRAVA